MYARTAGAVPSGRMVTDRPSRSSNVYICFSTTSVTSPTERTNRGVYSRIGVRASRYENDSSTDRAFSSRKCHFDTSGARMSFMPFTDGGTSAMADVLPLSPRVRAPGRCSLIFLLRGRLTVVMAEPGWEKEIIETIPSGIDPVQIDRALRLTPTERLEQMRMTLQQLKEATRELAGDRLPRPL